MHTTINQPRYLLTFFFLLNSPLVLQAIDNNTKKEVTKNIPKQNINAKMFDIPLNKNIEIELMGNDSSDSLEESELAPLLEKETNVKVQNSSDDLCTYCPCNYCWYCTEDYTHNPVHNDEDVCGACQFDIYCLPITLCMGTGCFVNIFLVKCCNRPKLC